MPELEPFSDPERSRRERLQTLRSRRVIREEAKRGRDHSSSEGVAPKDAIISSNGEESMADVSTKDSTKRRRGRKANDDEAARGQKKEVDSPESRALSSVPSNEDVSSSSTHHDGHEGSSTDLVPQDTEPDFGYSTGILTATEMETVLEDIKRHEVPPFGETEERKVYVYVESETTGRFFKYSTTLEPSGGASRRVNATTKTDLSAESAQSTRENQLARTKQAATSTFLLLQGILAGFSVQTLYDAIPIRPVANFLMKYSARANETRRFYFVAISFCLTCCLSTVVPPRERWSRERTSARQNAERWSLVVCYLIALILALPIAVVDVQFSALSRDRQANEEEVAAMFLSGVAKDLPNVRLWRALSTARSLFCIIAWMVACEQHFRRQTIRSEAMPTTKELKAKDSRLEGEPRRLEEGLRS